jgi:hypothetical protein
MWLSLVEHRVRDAGVAGSNPVIPTIFCPHDGALVILVALPASGSRRPYFYIEERERHSRVYNLHKKVGDNILLSHEVR